MQVQKVSNLAFNLDSCGQTEYPNHRILAKNNDFKLAYCQLHLHWKTTSKTVTQLPGIDLALMSLKLPFGGKSCHNNFCVISESVCDLIRAIKQNKGWDPIEQFEKKHHLVPQPRFLDNSFPFADGIKLIVDILINPQGTNKVYIDILISLMVEIEGTETLIQCDCAPLMAFDICTRPLHNNKPIPCKTMEAMNKLQTEAPLEEQKTILGWLVDFLSAAEHAPRKQIYSMDECHQ
jgi:hypothetical protein